MTKRCPFCTEAIAAQVVTCPHCDRQLQDVLLKTEPEFAPPPAPPHDLARWRRTLSASILALGIACWWAVAQKKAAERHDDYSTRTAPLAPYRTTAADLYAHYTAYEAATRGEPPRVGVELSGTIKSVDRTMFAEFEIHLDAGEDSEVVAVTLDPNQNKDEHPMIAGQSITVRCDNMSRVLAQPTGQNCRLVD